MKLTIKELPISERPYEKMEMYGSGSLSNSELLAIIIKSGTKEETSLDLAHRIICLGETKDNQDLRFLQEISIEEFMSIRGIGKVKSIQLKAVAELAKRMSKPVNSFNIKISNTEDVANLLMEELRYEKREVAKLLILNSKNIVLKIIDISLGGTNFSAIEPKHVLCEPIRMQASSIILVHNHPSGDPKPSKGDFTVTDRIHDVAMTMGINLLDHIVIGDGRYESILGLSEN